MDTGFTTTAEYENLSVALRSFWQPFSDLVNEMQSFVPRPLSDFDDRKQHFFEQLRKLNPDSPDHKLMELAESQIKSNTTPEWQFIHLFSERFMTLNVTVTLLAHALCEAEINALLATGLFQAGSADLFKIIQKADIKEKWVTGPKSFCPEYELSKSTALYETLNRLNTQRNAWMHHKIDLHVGDKKIIEGSKYEKLPYVEEAKWLERFFSLPYDLAEHALNHTQLTHAAFMIYTRAPIPKSKAHYSK